MGDPTVLKGVYREGAMIASVVQQDSTARIMLKGAEPAMPADPAFLETLKTVTKACWEHVEKFQKRELVAVLLQRPVLAEHVDIPAAHLKELGLRRISIIDGDSAIVIRACEDDPPPTPLAYASLRASSGLPVQPGLVAIPPTLLRKTYRDLTPPQRQVYEVVAQLTRNALMKLVCLEDEGLKMSATVRDFPPARARTILLPLGSLADELGKGVPIQDIAKRMEILRAG